MKRILTAVVFIPLFLLTVALPAWAYFLLLATASVLAVREVGALARRCGVAFPGWLAAPATVAIVYAFLDRRLNPVGTVGLVVVILPVLLLAARWSLERAAATVGITLLTAVVLGVLVGIQMEIRVLGEEIGQQLVLFFFLVVWAGDTGAYYVGSLIGRHPVLPRISPSKTIEGTVGGSLASLAAGAGGAGWFLQGVSPWMGAALGFLLNAFGQYGDLLESSLKRVSGVKDSASLLPGHGGILDRLDSIAVAGPAFYVCCLFLFD